MWISEGHKYKIIDNHYIIYGYLYAFKKELMNGRISLRFVNRKKCGTLLKINKNEYNFIW